MIGDDDEEQKKIDALKAKERALREKRDALKEKLTELKKKFLKSKNGKKAQQEIDRSSQERDKQIEQVRKEHQKMVEKIRRERPDDIACCVDRSVWKETDKFLMDGKSKANEEHDERVDRTLRREMGEHDKKALDRYDKLKKDIEKASAERFQAEQDLFRAQGLPTAPGVSP